jgi:hypothetical protein
MSKLKTRLSNGGLNLEQKNVNHETEIFNELLRKVILFLKICPKIKNSAIN